MQGASAELLLNNHAIQTKLMDYINDSFITELLTGILKYMNLIDKPDYRKHAESKAKELFTTIKRFHAQSKLISKPSSREATQLDEPEMTSSQKPSEIKKYKQYKTLSLEEKI